MLCLSSLGYLIDDPNPVEYSTEEEEDESASSNASSSEAENDGAIEKNTSKTESSEDENLQAMISELDGLNEDNEGAVVDLWLPRSARKKHKKDGTDHPETSLTDKLLEENGEDESEDEDWQPGSKRKMAKKKGVEDIKKVKQIDTGTKHETKKHDSSTKDSSPIKAKKKTPKDTPTTASNGLHDSIEENAPGKEIDSDEKSAANDNKMASCSKISYFSQFEKLTVNQI